jgi:hypothetical protein
MLSGKLHKRGEKHVKQFWTAIIALGLWANAAALWLRPAQAEDMATSYLKSIDSNIFILLHGGSQCRNTKICD